MKPLNLIFIPLSAFLLLLALAAVGPASAQAGCQHSGDPVKRIAKKDARDAINCLFNKERSAKNISRNGDLEAAAQNHSVVMARQSCLSHQCSGEGNLQQRVARTGYMSKSNAWGVGEVVLVGRSSGSARQIVKAWMDSSGHRGNIMSSSHEHVGIGLAIHKGYVWATGDLGHR